MSMEVVPVVRRSTVLVVDDDDALRMMVASVLQASGHEVLTAASAEQAMALSNARPDVDVLLTDVTLPRMDGRELAARIASRHPGLGVLVMSGDHDAPAPYLPHATFLPKPFRLADLVAAVRRLIT